MDGQNPRGKQFESTFDEKEIKKNRTARMTELRKSKRAEAVYTKRNFAATPNTEVFLDCELTLLYLRSGNLEEFMQGANAFAKFINETHSESFIETCVDCLMSFPSFSDVTRAFISTSLLASLSNSAYSGLITAYITTFIPLIPISDVKIQENIYWVLGNIALDSDRNRESILSDEFLNLSWGIVQQPQSEFIVKKVCWCISHCCKGKFVENQIKAVPFLSLALKCSLVDIYPEVLWALAHVSEKKVEVVNDKEYLSVVIKLLKIDLVKFQQPAIRVIGNVLSGNEAQIDMMISGGVIKALVYCLEHKSKLIRQEAMWAFSNICATKYVKDLASKGVIKRIIDLSITDCQDIQTEAVWSLFNAIFISDASGVKDLVDLGVLSAVCYLLNLVGNRAKLLLLRSIEKILKAGQEFLPNPYVEILESNGGKETIENLLMSQNEKINSKSSKILNEYFEDVQKEMELVPTNNFEF